MARAAVVCAVPGCPEAAAYRGRCPGHAAEYDAAQKRTVPTKVAGRKYAEVKRRAQAVAEHRARFGNLCPGWGRPPHRSDDLTAQHVDALVLDGDLRQRLAVLCRSCNSRHGLAARRTMERAFG